MLIVLTGHLSRHNWVRLQVINQCLTGLEVDRHDFLRLFWVTVHNDVLYVLFINGFLLSLIVIEVTIDIGSDVVIVDHVQLMVNVVVKLFEVDLVLTSRVLDLPTVQVINFRRLIIVFFDIVTLRVVISVTGNDLASIVDVIPVI